jgi:hypothetical protein
MAAAGVDLFTFSDADFARAFQWLVGDEPFDFTGYGLAMMVRKRADDAEVTLSLSTDNGSIDFTPDVDGKLTTFNVRILRSQMTEIQPGDYVHSLIRIRPDGLHDDLWRGALTHTIGPTR